MEEATFTVSLLPKKSGGFNFTACEPKTFPDTKDGFKEFARTIEKIAWSPFQFGPGQSPKGLDASNHYRALDFLLPEQHIPILALDVDNGNPTLKEAIQICKDLNWRHLVAKSRNHQKDKGGLVCDRYRIVFFLKTPLTQKQSYEIFWKAILKRFPTIDESCGGCDRFYYPSPGLASALWEGELIDWWKIIEEDKAKEPPKSTPRAKATFPTTDIKIAPDKEGATAYSSPPETQTRTSAGAGV